MIKLIVTDLDGTLLEKENSMPKNFEQVFESLQEKGVHFAVATGRNFEGLQTHFIKYIDKMSFICDNGAFIMMSGNLVKTNHIEIEYADKVFTALNKYKATGNMIDYIACGQRATYYTHSNANFRDLIETFYTKAEFVDDMKAINDNIFKISVNDVNNPIETGTYKFMAQQFEKTLNVQPSGEVWLDIMKKGINKGYAVEYLQKLLGVSPNETMVFGDYYNDISMMKKAKFSFAMPQAPIEVKCCCNYVIRDDVTSAVTQTIKDFVLL